MPYYLNDRKLMRGLASPLSFMLAGVIVISCYLAGGPLEGARAATSRQSPARTSAAAAQWTRSGPHEGTVTAIAVSQSAPATVYAHVGASGAY